MLRLLEALEQRGLSFRSLTESIETSTPAGRMFFHMLGAFAEFERAMIRERCAAGFEAAKARGQKFRTDRSLHAKTEAKLVRMYQSQKYAMLAWLTTSRFTYRALSGRSTVLQSHITAA